MSIALFAFGVSTMSDSSKLTWQETIVSNHLQAIACDYIVPFRMISPSAKPKPICNGGPELDGSKIVDDQHRASNGRNSLSDDVV